MTTRNNSSFVLKDGELFMGELLKFLSNYSNECLILGFKLVVCEKSSEGKYNLIDTFECITNYEKPKQIVEEFCKKPFMSEQQIEDSEEKVN